MATPETLPESPKAEQTEATEKDESKVSQRHWPWIVGGLVIAIFMLWDTHKEDQKLIQQLNNDRVKENRDLAFAWQQVAQERSDLKAATAYLLHYTNDTTLLRRIDSSKRAEQPR